MSALVQATPHKLPTKGAVKVEKKPVFKVVGRKTPSHEAMMHTMKIYDSWVRQFEKAQGGTYDGTKAEEDSSNKR